MARFAGFADTWDNIKEVDLRPLRQQALSGIRIALVGAPGSGRKTLAEQMRRDPRRPSQETQTPVMVLDLESAAQAAGADLVILVIDGRKTDVSQEKGAARDLSNLGKRVLIFINHFEEPGQAIAVSPLAEWGKRHVVWGSALDTRFLVDKLAPAVIGLVPERILGLGRYFPLFRVPVAHYLVNDACVTNAAYSLSTGLAETFAIFDLAVVVADTVVLTKNQAFLAYKLGLALGYSTRWQDYIVEFGGVLGNGLFWRQIAHTLVGLIPVWGIVPKTAISYAGTYMVGNVVLQWYLTGRHISGRQMKQLYSQAFERGKSLASGLLRKLPHPRLPERKPRALPTPRASKSSHTCSACGKRSARDARFCQYCGQPLTPTAGLKSGAEMDQ
jgi:hypothetical protein